MATNERKVRDSFDMKVPAGNPNAIADKGGDLPGGGRKITARRAKASCSDEYYSDEADGEGHWYGGKNSRQ